jgi:arylsulfatase A-like enzyme
LEADDMPNDGVQREVLPIPEIPPVGLTTYDAKDPATSYPPITPLRPPAGAPNLLVVLLDDVGFGAASVFGGPCQTPTFERLASNGLRYTRFHTTSLCSPTRAALLSGRNHHSVGMGGITEIATAAPGYSSLRPNTKATVRETIAWVRQQTALTPDKPFFAYFAPGATHAPHHVPTEWADRYRAASTTAGTPCGSASSPARRNSESSPRTLLTPRHAEIPAWDDMDEQLKPVLARQMEVYAGFLEHTDHHVGRLLQALEELGVLEDTLVYVIVGDNGASAEAPSRGPSTR